MLDLFGMKRGKRRLSGLLGLALDGSRLEGVVLRRTNGSAAVQEVFSVSLSLDPLTADPQLVGREIRNHLDAAEVRERRCVVGLPLKWALTTQVEVPALPEADMSSFLQIEAERGFPCDAATLLFNASRSQGPSGKEHALLAGIPRNHLMLMEQALRAARLRPLSFSLGIVGLQPPRGEKSEGVLALAIGETQVGLQVACGGGIAALRALEGALEVQAGRRVLHAELVAREARITLGQLPSDLRDTVRRIRIFGPRDLAQQLADELELRLEPMGLKLEVVTRYATDEFGLHLPGETGVSPALSLAAGYLTGRRTPFEFLPPRVRAWHQVAARYSSRKLRVAGAAVAAIVCLASGSFAYQQWQLSHLNSQWLALAPKVTELQKLQQQIRQFRPWFDDSIRGLTILRQLTTAFPEDGVVSAKTLEIRDLSVVTCTGTARDNQSLLKTVDRLRGSRGVADFHTSVIRGRSPIQFTFDFHWSEGGQNEN